MLPHGSRLRAQEVRAVLKMGKTVRTPHFFVKYIPEESSAVAVVVSKKIAKKATARNAIRRAIYDSFPTPLPPGAKAVFLVQKSVPDPSSEIKTICSKLFS